MMTNKENLSAPQQKTRNLKDLVNTPFKRVMLGVQILSYILIVGSPLIGGAIGGLLGLNAKKIGGLILAIFIAGEILFYGSLAFLGKEIILLIRDRIKKWLKKSNQVSNQSEAKNG
jgi:hypothetical protein